MKLSIAIFVNCFTTLLLISITSNAGVNVLDFDSFENGQVINDEYLASYGVSIDSLNFRDGGIEGR